MTLIDHWNHWVVIVLMMTGFYVIMASTNLVKKVLGLNVFQASVILLYVTMAKVDGGTAAIFLEDPHAAHDAAGHGGEGDGDAADEGHATDDDHADERGHAADEGHAGARADEGDDAADASHAADDGKVSGEGHAAPDGHGADGHAPAHHDGPQAVVYSNPLPHVLMLTAIVVGVATTALALALVVRIQEAYGTIEEDELLAIEEPEA